MSIQDLELQKQQYLDEMKSMINQIQIEDYRNERIDIHYRKECEIMIDELKLKFNEMSIEINKLTMEEEIPRTLIMRNEELSTIPKKESDEIIKSSVEDLVPIPKAKSVTFSNPLFDSNDDFTSSDDESLSDEDVQEDNVKIYSNPLFKFDDEYISSDINPLFDEVLENIENKDSYDSNLDKPDLLVTPLYVFNEDECFYPGGDVDEINSFNIPLDCEDGYYDSEGDILYLESLLSDDLLHHDPFTPTMSVASILDGFTDEPPLEENNDLFDLESRNDEWKKILYNAPIDDLMTEDKFLTLGFGRKFFLQHDCPDCEDARARGFCPS
nr:hypothetical protein [Tanacetum cinerariifolium]